MAEAQLFVLQDEFTCSVCLNTLTDPVTIPCGHNFCLKCLMDCWDQSQECSCPHCRHTFTTRPALRRNTLLSEVVKKLKKTRLSSPSQNYAGPGDVECDFCTRKKFRPVKSCLTCMASYCQTHLLPHYEGDALKHHKLVDPDRNLKEKLCEKHHKSLEFCKSDETCICMMCEMTEHKSHERVELVTETEGKQVTEEMKVRQGDGEGQKMVYCVLHGETYKNLTGKIREQEKREMEKAEGVMEQLEKEIEELKRREAELKELSETKDHIHFLQVRATLHRENVKDLSCFYKCSAPLFTRCLVSTAPDWFLLIVCVVLRPQSCYTLPDFLTCFLFSPFRLLSLTLDINTANRYLRLSEGNKKVTCEGTKAKYPDHPDRFDHCVQVLCREALTGTCCYWEVECSERFMKIGVAYKGLTRKGDGGECGLGYNDKSWCLVWSLSQYSVRHNKKEIVITAPYSPRIGVFLDWPAGSLSFYRVSHTMTLLHRFNTSFTEPLYPGFGFGLHCSVTICHLTPCDH
uniref:Uncharacterized protein n=1 Tax=Erpetoichthys calabaricus TaxID=27687 RepID=A0A8C4RJJ3_ERPCA